MAKLLLFASIKEKLGQDALEISQDITSIAQLREWLLAEHPIIEEELQSIFWAKNQEFAEESATIEDNDEIAIISPVSGG